MIPARRAAFALIVEDHPLVADSLLACVREYDASIEVGMAQSLRSALRLIESHPAPLLIITDLALTDCDGIESVRRLREAAPHTPLLVVTAVDNLALRAQAKGLGATGYIVKSASVRILRAEIRKALGNRPAASDAAPRPVRAPDRLLTPKQLTVLEELAAGRSNKEIALRMGISDETVGSHVKEIFGRLKVRNRTEAVVQLLRMRH